MFSTRSSVYDPANYNTGSVFPYLANFNILALFEHGQPLAAEQQLLELAELDGFSGLGFVPEHLRGDRREEPARGVPHQIFSSAARLQSASRAARAERPDPWAEFRAPLRILFAEESPGLVRWRVAGPAGTLHVLPFRTQRLLGIEGAQLRGPQRLEIRLPERPPEAIVEHVIEFRSA
jgi:hypothetical protein